MKRILLLLLLCLLLAGCGGQTQYADIAATTLPVYDFTTQLCAGTPLTVTRLVTESVSCLHDYSLNVRQVKAAEAAQVIVLSGAGLEDFLDDLLLDTDTIDASTGISLLCAETEHDHGDHADPQDHDGHHHEQDPHIWLSPENAMVMARNISAGLSARYPEYAVTFETNLSSLEAKLSQLHRYGEAVLSDLSCRELITFHDGFSYLADAYHLTILEAVEEESGSEASARELIALIEDVEHHNLPAIFTERSGSASAASIIARETGAGVYQLDMAMAGDDYFEAMYHNLDTLREALQ